MKQLFKFSLCDLRVFALLVLMAFSLMFSSCNSSPARSFAGTYVNHSTGDYSTASDTLVVAHDRAQHYLIHRKTSFQIIDEQGKPGKLQWEAEEWTADYDPKTELMTELGSGKLIRFDTKKGLLILGRAKYQRIH